MSNHVKISAVIMLLAIFSLTDRATAIPLTFTETLRGELTLVTKSDLVDLYDVTSLQQGNAVKVKYKYTDDPAVDDDASFELNLSIIDDAKNEYLFEQVYTEDNFFSLLEVTPTSISGLAEDIINPFQPDDPYTFETHPDENYFSFDMFSLTAIEGSLSFNGAIFNQLNDDYTYNQYLELDFSAVATPEPSTILLFLTGILGLALYRKRKSR